MVKIVFNTILLLLIVIRNAFLDKIILGIIGIKETTCEYSTGDHTFF